MSSLFSSVGDLIKGDFREDDPDQTISKKILVTTLESIIEDNLSNIKGRTVSFKIETQGNEIDVIRGAAKALCYVHHSLLENIIQTPYEKQYDFDELISLIYANGFLCIGPMNISYRTTGEIGAVLLLFKKTKQIVS